MEELSPEISQEIERAVVCMEQGTVFRANLTFYMLPEHPGPCERSPGNWYQAYGLSQDQDTYRAQLNFFWTFDPVVNSGAETGSPKCYSKSEWGGEPYCSHHTDPLFLMCDEVSRFTKMADNSYRHQYCSKAVTWQNPFLPQVWDFITCSAWSDCQNNQGPYSHLGSYEGNPPGCNTVCECGGKYDDNPGEGSSSGVIRRRDQGCDGIDGEGSSSGVIRRRDQGCDGIDGEGSSSGVIRRSEQTTKPYSLDFASELLEALSLVQLDTALQSQTPWMDILAQMCSCSCGPAL